MYADGLPEPGVVGLRFGERRPFLEGDGGAILRLLRL